MGLEAYEVLARHCDQLTGHKARKLLPLTVHRATTLAGKTKA